MILPVAACNGQSLTPATTQAIGNLPANITLSQNSEQRWVISNGNAAEDLTLENVTFGNMGAVLNTGESFGDPSDIDSFFQNVILTAATPSGAGEALFAFSPSVGTDGRDIQYFELERTGPTAIPESGEVIMQGTTAVLVFSDSGSLANRAEGRAELTADFGTGFIAGRTFDITSFGSTDNVNYLAVNFEQTEIINGAFSGIVDPVEPDFPDGTYDGLIVAADGNEAVGSYTFLEGGIFPVYGIFTVAAP